MINIILTAISFLIIGLLFSWLKGKIVKKFMNTSKKIITNARIGNSYKKDGTEAFKWDKFKKIFYLGSRVEWVKSIKEIIDLRKLLIYMTVVGLIFAYGYFRGRSETPVTVDLGYGKEVYIRLNGDFLHIDKNGYIWVENKNGKKLKQIAVKDIPALKKKLSPVGLELTPIGVIGGGMSADGRGALEAGVGVSFARFWKWRLDAFVTSYPAVYLGTSYKLDGIGLKNSRIGIAVGKGLREWQLDQSETRALIYIAVGF